MSVAAQPPPSPHVTVTGARPAPPEVGVEREVDRILTPVRGGPHAELALAYASALGRYFDASVDVMHIVPPDISPVVRAQAERALAKLKELATSFADERTPYYSLVHPMWKTNYGDYDHLARVKEWSLTGGGDEGGGE